MISYQPVPVKKKELAWRYKVKTAVQARKERADSSNVSAAKKSKLERLTSPNPWESAKKMRPVRSTVADWKKGCKLG